MIDQGCNKSPEQKKLDEFLTRITDCSTFIFARAAMINDVCDRLDGGKIEEGKCGEAPPEPLALFDKLSSRISDLEVAVRALESNSDRLNAII